MYACLSIYKETVFNDSEYLNLGKGQSIDKHSKLFTSYIFIHFDI